MRLKQLYITSIAIFMATSVPAFANDRLVAHKPSHSQSALPCGMCHLRENPELMPKLKRVNNVVYLEECGACHFAYQPEWLPQRSWKKIIGGLKQHFGEEIELSPGRTRILTRYVMQNSADLSKAARAKMAMASLPQTETPIRVMDIPYIHQKHQKISADVIARKSIRSFANCEACHISARGGMYIQKHINIPPQ